MPQLPQRGGGTTRGVLTWGGWAADHLCLACLGDHFFITFFMVGTTFTSIFIHFLPSPRASNNQPTNLHLPLEGGSEGIPTTFLCQQFPSLFLVKILFLVNFAIVTGVRRIYISHKMSRCRRRNFGSVKGWSLIRWLTSLLETREG